MRKARQLQKGDKAAIVSLSSGILGEAFCEHQIRLGVKRMKEIGLEPVFMPNALKGLEYVKNHPEARAQDLKDAFLDKDIKGIFCVIGGDDTYRLLPYLMEDKAFLAGVRESPKLFTGFSDTTVNHLMFYKMGLQTFYGPNFLCDLAELGEEMLPYTYTALKGYFENPPVRELVSSEVWYEERTDFSERQAGIPRIQHRETRGYEVLQGSGRTEGRLLGGCLESLYEMLVSERYSDEREVCDQYGIFPEPEEWKDKLLFLETCEEKPVPELLEEELRALENRGVFDQVRGILVGKPQDEKYYEEYKQVYRKVLAGRKLPVLYNLNFGHALPRCVIPYGCLAQMDLDKREVRILEPYFGV